MRRRHLTVALAFTATLILGGFRLQAQSHSTEPAQAELASSTAHATEGQPAHGEAAAAHHGPEVKLFGVALGQIGQFAVRVVNFAIFFAILYVILKSALASAFKARAKELEEQLSQAEKDKAEGEAQLKELEVKMAGMHTELEGIMAKAETDAESEKQRILAAARTEAALILSQAQAELISQKRLAEKELRALVAELAVEGAVKRLETRVQGATAERVLDRAIQEVGGAK